jgi:hypothetical protein
MFLSEKFECLVEYFYYLLTVYQIYYLNVSAKIKFFVNVFPNRSQRKIRISNMNGHAGAEMINNEQGTGY